VQDDEKFDLLLGKLDVTMRLLAHLVAQQHDTLETKALALSSAGVRLRDIATVCGTTSGSVSVRLAVGKKRGKRKKKSSKRK
jgi:hypothetical protein